MNTRVKSTAIMMALIITLSVLTALATTTTVAAHTTTTTKITASNTHPYVGQSVTFTVTLKAGTTGLSKPVHLWCTVNGVRVERGTFNTVNGVYKFSGPFSKTATVIYHADFKGDSSYAASSGTVTVYVGTKTTTTVTASNKYPAVGQSVTVTVTLKSEALLLSGKLVTIYRNGVPVITKTTNAAGQITLAQTYSSTGQRTYAAKFAGTSSYAASSGTVTVYVGTKTTSTITTSNKYPAVGEAVTITVTLKAGTAPLKDKEVHIWLNGFGYAVKTTNAAGQITFNQAYSSAGPNYYAALFLGDSSYAASISYLTVNVGKAPTTTTITVSNANPAIGEPVTITVTLKAGTTGLSKPVKVSCTYMDEPYFETTFNTVNGVNTFSAQFAGWGHYVLLAEFAGDSSYGASSGTATLDTHGL